MASMSVRSLSIMICFAKFIAEFSVVGGVYVSMILWSQYVWIFDGFDIVFGCERIMFPRLSSYLQVFSSVVRQQVITCLILVLRIARYLHFGFSIYKLAWETAVCFDHCWCVPWRSHMTWQCEGLFSTSAVCLDVVCLFVSVSSWSLFFIIIFDHLFWRAATIMIS